MNTIKDAIKTLKNGGMVIVVDAEERENEGDIVIAAEKITAQDMNFIVRNGCGLTCMPMTGEKLDKLGIPLLMVEGPRNGHFDTAFTISIEAAQGVTTGISAADRAQTARVAADPNSTSADICMPGHMFPLRARDNGVLERQGHTEAAVDLMRLAGLEPAAVICEIMAEDGSMMRYPQLVEFSEKHHLPIISIENLVKFRLEHELPIAKSALQPICKTDLPTSYGEFKLFAYRDPSCNREHLVFIKGEPSSATKPLVRIHSECLTGEVFSSKRCDCGKQLDSALQQMTDEDCGVFIYLRQEGRGIGLINKLHAYALQQQGYDTVEANEKLGFSPDQREYQFAIDILESLDVKSMRLLTNNPQKYHAVDKQWPGAVERVPLEVEEEGDAIHYLLTKRNKLGHWLGELDESETIDEVIQ